MERKREKPELIGDTRLANTITLQRVPFRREGNVYALAQTPPGTSDRSTRPRPRSPKHAVTVLSSASACTKQ